MADVISKNTMAELGIDRQIIIRASKDLANWTADQVRSYQIEVGETAKMKLAMEGKFPRKKHDYRTVVDRTGYDRPIGTVKDYGVFEYVRKATMPEILQRAANLIRKISPFKTGQYISNNLLMVNGKEVPIHSIDQIELDVKDTIQLVNVSEYARKIEGYDISGGVTKRGKPRKRAPLSPQAPQGVYRLVARLLNQEFGKTAYIKYTFGQMNSARTVGVTKGRYKGTKRANRYPMIKISFSSGAKI